MPMVFLIALLLFFTPTHSAFGVGDKLNIFTTRSCCRAKSVVTGKRTSPLNLDPRIARMLDDEFYRETHLKEWNQERRKHDEAVLDRSVPAVFEVDEADLLEPTFHLQEKKDRKLARNNPQKYCADRCLTTGYCDAFEDFFNFSAQEVVQFCKECVLSDDEEPCDIPYDAMDEFLKKEDAEYRKSANKLAP